MKAKENQLLEKIIHPFSGYMILVVMLALISLVVYGIAVARNPFALGVIPIVIFLIRGFFLVNPNNSCVLVLFGKYMGTVKKNGFFWTNPFYTRQRISLRARNFETERVKVNDKMGNPILISTILVWRASDTYKAAFDVDDYEEFVKIQGDAAVRILASRYPYDNFDDDQTEITLRSGLDEVNHALEEEVTARLSMAGLEVMEARIGYLAYAPEIASSMLKRQQAEAIVAARLKIVEGAVGMVEQALADLSRKNIIDLDEEKKATMVSNLMIVLCSDQEVTPVINTGSLYN